MNTALEESLKKYGELCIEWDEHSDRHNWAAADNEITDWVPAIGRDVCGWAEVLAQAGGPYVLGSRRIGAFFNCESTGHAPSKAVEILIRYGLPAFDEEMIAEAEAEASPDEMESLIDGIHRVVANVSKLEDILDETADAVLGVRA